MGVANIVTYPDCATVVDGWWLVAGPITAAAAVVPTTRYQLPDTYSEKL